MKSIDHTMFGASGTASSSGFSRFIIVSALLSMAMLPLTLLPSETPSLAGTRRVGLAEIYRASPLAIVATLANLITQEAVIRVAPVAPLALSILMGTAAGFILKYVLDKKWIFFDRFTSHREEARKLSLYGLFSVVTTLVFWGFVVLAAGSGASPR